MWIKYITIANLVLNVPHRFIDSSISTLNCKKTKESKVINTIGAKLSESIVEKQNALLLKLASTLCLFPHIKNSTAVKQWPLCIKQLARQQG